MSVSVDFTSPLKIKLLNGPADYIQWRRSVRSVIIQDDPLLKLFEDNVDHTTVRWRETNAKVKAKIILCLGPCARSMHSRFVDEASVTAKELMAELHKTYAISNQQAIANLISKLDAVELKEGKDWQVHLACFLSVIDELSALDHVVSDQDRLTKLLRSLPNSLESVTVACSLNNLTFEQVSSAVAENIERRKKKGLWGAGSSGAGSSGAGPSGAGLRANITDGSGFDRDNHHGGAPYGNGRGGRGGRGCRGGGSGMKRTCHYCNKPGHFIRFCRLRIANEGGGRINRPTRGNGRGRGRGRGGRGGNNNQGYNGNNNHNNNSDDGNNHLNQMTTAVVNALRAFPMPDAPPPPPPRNPFGGAHMAQIKFKSQVAQVSTEKSDQALIDSGATHHFVHDKKLFDNYESITEAVVNTADGESRVVGKGLVNISLGSKIVATAYYAPGFKNHILATHLLSETYEVVFSSSLRPDKSCVMFKKGSYNVDDVTWETACVDGLYFASDAFESVGRPTQPTVNTVSRVDNSYPRWHSRLGHISSQKYKMLASSRDDVPVFENNIIDKLDCVPCLTAKLRKAPVRRSGNNPPPGTEIHYDLSGPFNPSLGGNAYVVHLIEQSTSMKTLYFIRTKDQVCSTVKTYIAYVENHFSNLRTRVRSIRSDGAGENMTRELLAYLANAGIKVSPSPPYAPESNGLAERTVQEHWTRARVLMFATDLPQNLWGESMNHANWLRNRVPSARVDFRIPLNLWDPSARIDFSQVLEFGAKGFAYIYYSKTVSGKKMLPRSELARFVGMESDTRLIRAYIPSTQRIRILRRADFHPISDSILPSVTSLLDGISRQRAIESGTPAEPDLEEALQATVANLDLFNQLKHVSGTFSASASVLSVMKPHKNYMGISDGPALPRSFEEACRIPHWAESIDREYNAHIRNKTWTYVKITPDMKPVPFKWAFRAKSINAARMKYLYKARCNLRGDLQEEGIDFDPDALYAPVAGHETLLLLFNYAAAENLDVEGCDGDNAYINGFIDIPIVMAQPTNSSMQLSMPGHACLLVKSLYGARQAGRIWGNLLHEKLTNWGFQPSTVDPRLYFFRQQSNYILLCVVVDDIVFASNNQHLLNQFKDQIKAPFQVKLYGNLKSFIRWSIDRSVSGINIHQRDYTLRLLARFGMSNCNAVYTPLSSTADLTDRRDTEHALSRDTHHLYRAIIGGLAYLSSCTRPDITYAVSLLSRHLHNPSFRHLQAAKRLLRYVAGTVSYGLKYRANIPTKMDVSLGAYVDADWGVISLPVSLRLDSSST